MTSRMIILAGAPEPAKLDWSEKSLLPDASHVESLPNKENMNIDSSIRPKSPSSKAFGAQWRQITTQRLQMRPILPKLNIDPRPLAAGALIMQQAGELDNVDRGDAEFFSLSELLGASTPGSDISEPQSRPSLSEGSSSIPDTTSSGTSAFNTSEGGPISEYYDHSFSIYEAIPSSQLSYFSDSITPGTPIFESSEDMFSASQGTAPGTPGGIIRTPSQRRLSQAPRPKSLSELRDIPNAHYLESISPQTMTVNLIVGIISIAPPRTVITGAKYGKPREVDLVEMIVGDDTKSNFTVSMWLPREMRVNWKDGGNPNPEGIRSVLRRNLKFMRPRDVVLLQNVALSSFRGKVHGQSLKGDVTKIDLLFRKKVDDDDLSGIYSVSNLRTASVGKDPQVVKVKKVRDWLNEFVGERDGLSPVMAGRKGKRNKGGYAGYGFLPEDTQ
ncbi:hypothetical protein A1O7_10040 [Cladophialophora yegresii CBS 114405]|uniref:Uncharacterized protein n=1 Tax=Cladophialophora yegresii CBS 114405 TaxID=1182544 RepID=W9W826_9EURO|nr:uncharacterized protein A1O7_10040 [Cladophialophora yegresii CBS 114405]EXJ54699.1 hypothetical protein A1O7_10040 [Cladophialophora yegresii CBS 114405]